METKHKTHIANAIEMAEQKAKYDEHAKNILSDIHILAWILKFTTGEFREYSVEEIQMMIEAAPEVSEVCVCPGKTNREVIEGISTEDTVPGEGEVFFDVRFYAVVPQSERIKIIINVEAQKKYYPGYDLVTRAIFYCARMLSAQFGVEFEADNYDDIKKVYSIWICTDSPNYAANTITDYRMEPHAIYGEYESRNRYDILSAVMICLGKDDDYEGGSPLHKILSVIFSEKLKAYEKEEILKYEFGIEMEQVKGEMEDMCNLSDWIEEKAIAQGAAEEKKATILIMLKDGLPYETIARYSRIGVEEIRKIEEEIQI